MYLGCKREEMRIEFWCVISPKTATWKTKKEMRDNIKMELGK